MGLILKNFNFHKYLGGKYVAMVTMIIHVCVKKILNILIFFLITA